ncbi:hypothetical protein CHS0354_030106 [Potamilus streckersoni]|uniref:NADP-dependent oxidoreductase domain-containing protein n=1 Tax=Potamilus streckersoni TaxID=2493646 RepID=A0AAE0VE11_9BIVA|nr:hypothetical protein CHS0354_030106 [Potamilus streckersoni]
MTWGEQNTEAEAHEQLDYALVQGINFIDTAEMYSVPPRKETYGLTESYIGRWLKARNNRKQIHWPERTTNVFGVRGFTEDKAQDVHATAIAETVEALQAEQKKGKIRYAGVSNETPWGMLEYLRAHEQKGLLRPVSVQNPYHLLNRAYEIGMAEISIREKIGLLAYSPLAGGLLSGKYRHGKRPSGARFVLFGTRFWRYLNPAGDAAVEKYHELATANGMSLTQMALAFVNTRPFLISSIIGATSMAQLKENIDSINTKLSPEVLQAIDTLHEEMMNPVM